MTQLRDSLLNVLNNSKESPARLDMYEYASRATLDVISAAGACSTLNLFSGSLTSRGVRVRT